MTAFKERLPTFPTGVHLGGREKHCTCAEGGKGMGDSVERHGGVAEGGSRARVGTGHFRGTAETDTKQSCRTFRH